MKKIIPLFFILLVLELLFSCRNKNHYDQILIKAERVTMLPDSVLILLEDIGDYEKLDEEQFANYLLLQIKARDKTDSDLSSDTLLGFAIDYFVRKKEYEKAANAYFYQNRVLQSQDRKDLAIKYCCLSKEYAEKIQEFNLLGLIYHDLSDLYKEQFNLSEALESSRKGLNFFLKAGNEKYAVYMYKRIGDVFLLSNQKGHIDSALVNYHKALEFAELENDQEEIYHIYQSISLNLCEAMQFEEAKVFIRKAIGIINNLTQNFNNYISLSEVYLGLNEVDSALLYVEKALLEDRELYLSEEYLYKKMLYRIYCAKEDYKSALSNLESCLEYRDLIYKNMASQTILEIQKKHDKESIENEKNELLIERLYIIIVCLLLFFSIPIIITFFRNRNRKQKMELLKARQTIESLEEMIETKNDKENKLREMMIEKLDLVKKVAQIKSFSNQNDSEFIKHYHNIFVRNATETLDWNNLYPIFNELYNNFAEKIKLVYPTLTEKDLQLCCLIRADFQQDEIGFIMSYGYESVKVIKMRMRKKLGFETNHDFLNFIRNL